VSIFYDLILDEKSPEFEMVYYGSQLSDEFGSQSSDQFCKTWCTGFGRNSKALIYLDPRKSPTGWGKGYMK
jgi:formylmethanofuran dehydrogenase subunit B